MKKTRSLITLLSFSLLLPVFSYFHNSNNVVSKAYAIDTSSYDYSKCYATIPTAYQTMYDTLSTSDNYEAFKNKLCTIISSNYQHYTYDSVGKNILPIADMDPENNNNVIGLYTGLSLSGGWNREHVWCKSHGFSGDGSSDPYCDAHHLRAANVTINSTRGNSEFGEVSGSYSSDIYGNKYGNSIWEPRDEIKGDCARMILYFAVRYKNTSPYNAEISTSATTDKIVTSGKSWAGHLNTLLKWHYQDPVSSDELYRNNVVYSFQKNRNPFIDHPEYVEQCWDVSSVAGYNVVTDIRNENVVSFTSAVQSLPVSISVNDEQQINNVRSLYDGLNNNERNSISSQILDKYFASVKSLRAKKAAKLSADNIKTIEFCEANLSITKYSADVEATFTDGKIKFSHAFWETSCGKGQLSLGFNAASKLSNFGTLQPRFTYGDYLLTDFEYSNIKSIDFYNPIQKRGKDYFQGWDILIEKNGDYQRVASGNTFQINMVANLSTPVTGKIAFVVYGNTFATSLHRMTVTLDDGDTNIEDLKAIQTKADLSFNYNIGQETSNFPSADTELSLTNNNASTLGFSDIFQMELSKTSGTTSKAIYNSVRLYKNNTLKISCAYNMTRISISSENAQSGTNYYVGSNCSYSVDGVNFSTIPDCTNIEINSKTFYLCASEAQARFSSMTIDYTGIYNAALRFGMLCSKQLITNISEDHNISGYGVFVAKSLSLGSKTITQLVDENKTAYSTDDSLLARLESLGIDTSTKKRANKNGQLTYYETNDNGVTLADFGSSIIFRARLEIPENQYKTPIRACAYFIIDGEFVLCGEREESVSSQAQKYTGYTGDIATSLNYLGSL